MKKYYEKWKSLNLKKTLCGREAMEAVKQDGYSLRYVSEQTEAICMEAVKLDGCSLRYVYEQIFTNNMVCVEANGKIVYISKESAKSLGL